MSKIIINPANKLKGEISVPGDKSISHRAIMLGAIANGETIIHNFLNSADCIATVNCFREMGIEIGSRVKGQESSIYIQGKGLYGLTKSSGILDVGNSGTTIRLLSGIFAGQDFETQITGDASIQRRPMKRIAEPLGKMGARIEGLGTGEKGKDDIYPPFIIKGGKLHGIKYELPIASAQVKSAILLAGLFAEGKTIVVESTPSRDHTERMLGYFGIPIKRLGNEISIEGGASFSGREIFVPGDISSAAYFIVAGILVPDSQILLRNVGINPTRDGIVEIIHRMGAEIEVLDEEIVSGEPRGNIKLQTSNFKHQKLKGIEIKGEIIPKIIDEIPIIAVLATQAEGDTVIRDAKELRVKESDRIKTVISELSKMGAKIDELPDGMIIHGKTKLYGAKIDSHGDHRIAMSCAIAGLIADGETIIENTDCIETSFPGFEKVLFSLQA